MKYKELKKLLYKTQLQLSHADKTVHDLIEFSDMQERHQQITEDALNREWIIREYLEERNAELIRAMA